MRICSRTGPSSSICRWKRPMPGRSSAVSASACSPTASSRKNASSMSVCARLTWIGPANSPTESASSMPGLLWLKLTSYLRKKLQVSVNSIYKWNEPIWQGLVERIDSLSHGLLFIGPAGVGKVQFAEQFAAWLLCESSQKATATAACGDCPSCQLLASGNHPDIRVLTLDEEEEDEDGETKTAKKKPSTQIKIDQVRALEDFVYIGSHRQGARVVVIHPAEAMNMAAANSLLKILEEPPANVYFILVSSNQRRLLPTLLSRCRKVVFGQPPKEEAAAWLKAQGVKNP